MTKPTNEDLTSALQDAYRALRDAGHMLGEGGVLDRIHALLTLLNAVPAE